MKGVKPTNSAVRFDTSSFSDDQSNVTNRQQAQHTSPKRKSTNHQIHSSSSSGSSFSPYVPPSAAAAVGHTSLINQNFAHQHNSHHPGHRQSSSFDTAMIDTSENFNQADGEVTFLLVILYSSFVHFVIIMHQIKILLSFFFFFSLFTK
jgi:hypothetical protein